MSYDPIPTIDDATVYDHSVNYHTNNNTGESANEFYIQILHMGSTSPTLRKRIVCTPKSTIKQVTTLAFSAETLADNSITYFYLGKLLLDENKTLEEYNIECGHVIHARVKPKSRGSTDLAGWMGEPRFRDLSANQNDNEALIDVANDRQWWLSDPQLNQIDTEGSNTDLLLGLLLGLCLGVFALLWLWNEGIPRKQRLGIWLGVLTNLGLGLLRVWLISLPQVANSTQQHPHSNSSNDDSMWWLGTLFQSSHSLEPPVNNAVDDR